MLISRLECLASEHKELSSKIANLQNYIKNEAITRDEFDTNQTLLLRQLGAMQEYKKLLVKRMILAWEKEL